MSTHCTIKFVVRSRETPGEPPEVSESRLLQYADGYEDYVRPRLDETLNQARRCATADEVNAYALAATYGAMLDNEIAEAREARNYRYTSAPATRLVTSDIMEAQAGRWQWLVEVDVTRLWDAVEWRVIGGSDFT